jgi:hypothetical protein
LTAERGFAKDHRFDKDGCVRGICRRHAGTRGGPGRQSRHGPPSQVEG